MTIFAAADGLRADPVSGLVRRVPRHPLPAPWCDVASAIAPSLAQCPDAEALVGRFGRYTYKTLDDAVKAAAAALWSLGVRPGQRVAASAGNHCDIVIAFLATQRLGAIWLGVGRQLAPPEKCFQIKDSGATVFLADRAAEREIAPFREELPSLRHVVGMEPGDAGSQWAQLLAQHASAARVAVSIDPYAPAAIAYTSGTTGQPKGAVHSQHNMMVVAASFHAGLRGDLWAPQSRRGVSLALTILNMMILDVVTPLSGGGVCVCMDRTDAAGVVDWIQRERIETLTAVPPTIVDFLAKAEISPDAFTSVSFISSGGAPVPDDLSRRFEARFGKRVIPVYGLTEAPTSVSGLAEARGSARRSSCGRAYAHLRIAILDRAGDECSPGEVGEIAVRAAQDGPWSGVYTPMLGYWGHPAATDETLANGWLHTGDLGYRDSAGNLFVKERLTELIIRGGANVYPAEVERVLNGDARVLEAAVVGRPDDRLGEIVCAFLQLQPEVEPDPSLLEDLRAACSAQLARYKTPERWHFIPELPRNAMKKVMKGKLREIARNSGPP